jgi:competence protein ComEC
VPVAPPSLPIATVVALALVAGAAAGVVLRVEDVGPVAGAASLVAALAFAGLWAWWRPATRLAVIAAVLSLAAGLGLGARAAREALAPAAAALAGDEPVVLEGVLRQDAVLSEFGVTCPLAVARVEQHGSWRPVSGGVWLTIGGSEAAAARDAWRAGRTVRLTATLRRPQPYRNFGTPDEETRLAWRGLRLFGSVKSARLMEVVARGTWLDEAAASTRAWARRTVVEALPDDPLAAAIVLAVLIGDRAGLPSEVEARLQRAGTYHVLAISGGNIAIVAALVLAAIARIGLAPRARALAVLAVLAAYAAAVVGGASVARATLAAAVYLCARALDLRTPALNAVAVTVVLLIGLSPLSVVDVGFWLTTLASLAILVHAEGIAAVLCRGLPAATPAPIAWMARQAALLAAATLAAEAAVGPVTAFAFGQATLAGLALNFVAVPLMTVVQCAGFAILAAAAVHPMVAAAPAAVAATAASGIVSSAALVDLLPWLAWALVPPPLWLAAAAVLMPAIAWHGGTPRSLRRGASLAWGAALIAIASGRAPSLPAAVHEARRDRPCVAPPLPETGTWLRLVALDVGQGDATLIRFPDGATWLVDAGGTLGGRFDIGGRVVVPAVRALGVRTLSALLLTHADVDHVGGALGLIPLVKPAHVWEGVPVEGLAVLDAVRRTAHAAGAGWGAVAAGTRATVGGVDVRVLHPPAPDWTRRRSRNDDSVVLELRLRDVSLILPGDAGPSVEAALASALTPAALRVLKAGHHGSRSSSTPAFLDAAAPAVVLASAGRANRHGHPDPAVIDRVLARGAAFYRTDRDGAIVVDTDGRTVRVATCAGGTREFDGRQGSVRNEQVIPDRALKRGGCRAGRPRRRARRASRSTRRAATRTARRGSRSSSARASRCSGRNRAGRCGT